MRKPRDYLNTKRVLINIGVGCWLEAFIHVDVTEFLWWILGRGNLQVRNQTINFQFDQMELDKN